MHKFCACVDRVLVNHENQNLKAEYKGGGGVYMPSLIQNRGKYSFKKKKKDIQQEGAIF